MPIQVTCPGCHTRFQVSDKFAGQTGLCPKCKHQIRIPEKADEVVIHAPEGYGPKNAQGRAVLKTFGRADSQLSLTGVVAIVGSLVGVLAAVGVLRLMLDQIPFAVLAIGAVVLAPPIVFSGYTFLRNDELEPHQGTALGVRVLICSAVYSLLWLVVWFLKGTLTGGTSFELFQLTFVLPVVLGLGSFASFASLDLDFGSAALHCSYYLVVTALLRMLLGLSFV